MNYKYTIENLNKTFLEYGSLLEKRRLEQLEIYSDSEHLKEDFNINFALSCICEELIRLKNDD